MRRRRRCALPARRRGRPRQPRRIRFFRGRGAGRPAAARGRGGQAVAVRPCSSRARRAGGGVRRRGRSSARNRLARGDAPRVRRRRTLPFGPPNRSPIVPLAVEIDNVARRFGRVQALAGVSLAVEEGEFFGLLGPNGAGKTTLISVLAGLTRADAGTARVLGPRRRRGLPRCAPRAGRRAAGARVRSVLLGARDARNPVRLFRHPEQRRVDRRDPRTISISRRRPTPTCARCPAE